MLYCSEANNSEDSNFSDIGYSLKSFWNYVLMLEENLHLSNNV